MLKEKILSHIAYVYLSYAIYKVIHVHNHLRRVWKNYYQNSSGLNIFSASIHKVPL